MSRRKAIALMMGTAGLRRNDYQGKIRAGVEKRCIENDVDLWVYSGRNDWRTSGPAEGQVYELLDPELIDGIILLNSSIACFLDVDALLHKLVERCPVPACSIGVELKGAPSITVDNGGGMVSLVNHLVTCHGHERFAFLAGPREQHESQERLHSARAALQTCGRSLPDTAVTYGNFSFEAGVVLTRDILKNSPDVQAILVANDDMAAGVLKTLKELGRQCPETIAVTGFDDAPTAQLCAPSLTTVRQPIVELGARAADTIFSMWKGVQCPPLVTLQLETVLRESCGCDQLSGSSHLTPELTTEDIAAVHCTEIAVLLSGLSSEGPKLQQWANSLWQAVQSEASGTTGLLRSAIDALLDDTASADVPIYDLQRVISYLRRACSSSGATVALNDAFHDANIQIGKAMHRCEAERQLRDGFLMDELRLSWERLATALSFDSLRDVLLRDLPRFSVENAIVSVFAPGTVNTLVPLACIIDAKPVTIERKPFAAARLKPDELPAVSRRCSFAVMPLTFEWEPLGVALLELPCHAAYMVLREQIGSAVKTVRLHEMLMNQQERLKVQAEIERQAATERVRTMGLVAGGVAHDLNNVLGPLVALPEAIRRDLLQSNPGVSKNVFIDLDTMQDAAQRASRTILDLLTLGRAVDAPMQTYELNRILHNVTRTLSQLTERSEGVNLRMVLNESPLMVNVSREHIVRAVSNLVANATDSMQNPGEVVLRVFERNVSQRLDGVEPVEVGRYAVIEVQDSGCGIPTESLPRVFEPFFSSKAQTIKGGTGLGLAIVYQVVRQCLGFVQVTSNLDLGTTVALYLPLTTQGIPFESEPPAQTVGGNERILVVDDELVQLRTAKRVLSQLGYRVVTVESGAAAVDVFANCLHDEPFHLVILDMLMPGALNGLATLKILRQHVPAQKALMVSGYAPGPMSREATENGVGWLPKPYTPAALASAVRLALDSQISSVPQLRPEDP